MKSFKKFIAEKIPLSTYRSWAKDNEIDNIPATLVKKYSDWFDGKQRVYIPLKNTATTDFVDTLNRALVANDYKISDWEKGLAINIERGGNPQKIGKLLQRFIDAQKANGNSAYWEKHLKQYNDIRRQETAGDNDYYVVISRHPYDLAGMSADRWHDPKTKETKTDIDKWYRDEIPKQNGNPDKLVALKTKYAEKLKCLSAGWDSCKSILPRKSFDYERIGEYSDMLHHEYIAGSLVSYVVYQNDKNIQHPIARRILIPLHNIEDEEETVLYVGQNYGHFVKGFKETVDKWLIKHQGDVDYDDYHAYEEEMYTGDIQGEVKIKNEYAQGLSDLFENTWDIQTNDGHYFEADTDDFSILDAIFDHDRLSDIYDQYAYDQYNSESYEHNDQLHYIFNQVLDDVAEIENWFLEKFKERGGEPNENNGDEYLPSDFAENLKDYKFSDEAEEMARWYGEVENRKYIDEAKAQIRYTLNNTGFFKIMDDKIKIMISVDDDDEAYFIQSLIDYGNLDNANSWENFRQYCDFSYEKLIQEVYDEGVSPDDNDLYQFISREFIK